MTNFISNTTEWM